MSDIEPGALLPEDFDPPFQRLHPLSILVRFGRFLSQNIIVIGALYFGVLDQNPFYTVLLAGGVLALAMLVALLIWSRFTYQLSAQEIRIKSGLFNRNNRSIPFERIQDVSLEQKLIPRLLGLATVKLETGAGGGEDGKLDALALADAEALRDVVRDYKSGPSAVTDGGEESEPETDSEPLFAMDNRRLLIAGLFNFSFVLLAILGAIAQNLDFLLPGEMFNPRYWADLWLDNDYVSDLSNGTRIFGIVAALGALIFVGLASGIIRTFVRDYGFRLDRVKNGFRRRRGLFTLTDMVMPIHRVQAAILQTGPVRQRFGWHHLKIQSLAGDVGGETDHSTAPCATLCEIEPILAETNMANVTEDTAFHSVSPAMWWRNMLLSGLLIVGPTIAASQFVHPGLYALALVWFPLTAILILNWHHHQYALIGDQLFVRRGWWKRSLTILPIRKVQTADINQSPLDHPLNLATVTIGVAGGSALSPLRIRHIPRSDAEMLRERLLQPFAESRLTLPAEHSR